MSGQPTGPEGSPRWAKIFAIVLIVIVLVIVVILMTDKQGRHGPGRHAPRRHGLADEAQTRSGWIPPANAEHGG